MRKKRGDEASGGGDGGGKSTGEEKDLTVSILLRTQNQEMRVSVS